MPSTPSPGAKKKRSSPASKSPGAGEKRGSPASKSPGAGEKRGSPNKLPGSFTTEVRDVLHGVRNEYIKQHFETLRKRMFDGFKKAFEEFAVKGLDYDGQPNFNYSELKISNYTFPEFNAEQEVYQVRIEFASRIDYILEFAIPIQVEYKTQVEDKTQSIEMVARIAINTQEMRQNPDMNMQAHALWYRLPPQMNFVALAKILKFFKSPKKRIFIEGNKSGIMFNYDVILLKDFEKLKKKI